MKFQKGVTIASLAIYVVLIFVVLAILATITANMQGGIKKSNREGTEIAEINKFNMYFLKEVKKEGNEIVEQTDNKIEFSSGNTYLFNNKKNSIELEEGQKTIAIANNIDSCTFSTKIENEKTVIVVTIRPKRTGKVLTNEYVLKKKNINYENEENYVYNSVNE